MEHQALAGLVLLEHFQLLVSCSLPRLPGVELSLGQGQRTSLAVQLREKLVGVHVLLAGGR